MNVKKVEDILKIFKNSCISKLNFEDTEIKVTMQKSIKKEEKPVVIVPNQEKPKENSANILEEPFSVIRSNHVGFFHHKLSSKEIDAQPEVKPGKLLGTVRAMNIDHDILADRECKLIKYIVEEGTPVGYGQEVVLVRDL
ncbi:MAG: hypothetical protein PHV30_05625 [Candidatus Margulisbacteria bacterium]|nr:hypothetical protein [Candidatus Margulisiibacteriota bacterium]